LKVAYVTAHYPANGTGERFVEPEVRALADYVELVIVPTQPLKLVDKCVSGPALREFLRAPASATRLLVKLVFAHGRLRARGMNVLAFPRGLALAREIRSAKIEHIHAIGLGVPSTVAYVASQMTGVPYSMGIHEHEIPDDGLTGEKLSKAKFTRTVSSRTCRDLQALVPSAASHCLVVRSGVTVPARAPDPPIRRIPRILVAGSDPSDVLNALAQLRDRDYAVWCDLVSDSAPARVERLLRAYHLRGRAILLGPIAFDKMGEALARGDYDVFVLASGDPSDVREDVPVLALQAMATGVATVAVQGASLDEVIDAGSGFLVAPHDVQGLFAVLERLVLDSGLRHRTGQRARERVLHAFEIERTTRELATRLYGPADFAHASPLTAIPGRRSNGARGSGTSLTTR
jgi:colanic acid/amylovoran biosynthesis glycosyltransferase